MALIDIVKLASDAVFRDRVSAQLVASSVAIYNEAANEVQTLSVTGSPTGGAFTLASLPGSTILNMNGTTANAAATLTGLTSTQGLFVGMSVVGQGVAANATIATITSLTAVTLSANSTASATVPCTFSGTPVAQIPFNAGAADVQAILQALAAIGNDDIVCTGGPLPGTAVAITFCGSLGLNPQRLITIGTNSLTGGSSPAPSVARTTAGTIGQALHTARASRASQILRDLSGHTAQMVWGVAANTAVQADFTGGGGVQTAVTDANIAAAVAAVFNSYI